jgi:hypothetical protein
MYSKTTVSAFIIKIFPSNNETSPGPRSFAVGDHFFYFTVPATAKKNGVFTPFNIPVLHLRKCS